MTAGAVAVPTIIPLKAPSGHKHIIDSATEVELRSATAGALIFYTLNGTRPDPYQRQGKSHTYSYHSPFTLPPGKVTVRAVATSGDGLKESSVVTKTFQVEEGGRESGGGSAEEENPPSPSSPPQSLSAQLRHTLTLASRTSVGQSSGPPSSPLPHSTSAPLSTTSTAMKSPHTVSGTPLSTVPRQQTKEKPHPVCVYCSAPRQKDPRYKYCSHCGSRLPPLPLTSTKPPLQVAVCPSCRAQMPADTLTCLVCESSVIQPQPPTVIQAQANSHHDTNDQSVCLSCGTANPPSAHSCLTCEKSLPSYPPPPPPSPPPLLPPPLPTPTTMHPVSGSSYLMCGGCGRVNVSDARFCDWCGARPEGSQLSLLCVSCSSTNDWHARHCHSCGGLLKAPLRPGVELAPTMKIPVDVDVPGSSWVPVVELEDHRPETRAQGTQTEGLFYPSSRAIAGLRRVELSQKVARASSRDRVTDLEAFSPGKGLWRMQVEHVCSHLRAHALSSPTLQSSIGTPQMGKLLQAVVKEDDNQVNLQLTFSLKESDGHTTARAGRLSPTPSSVTRVHSQKTPASRKQRQKAQPAGSSASKNLDETRRLLGELSEGGQGRREVVEELLQKGAPANAVDSSGLPVLSLAAANGHLECIAALVEGGASINAQAKSTGNTALHEAVLKGPIRTSCIEALLSLGARAGIRNRDGLTPCELATRLNYQTIVAALATQVGSGLLDRFCRAEPSLTL